MRNLSLQVIAELLSGEEIDGLKNIFNAMDVNKKGLISYEELKAGLHKLGSQLAENEVQQLMEAVSVFLLVYLSFKIIG